MACAPSTDPASSAREVGPAVGIARADGRHGARRSSTDRAEGLEHQEIIYTVLTCRAVTRARVREDVVFGRGVLQTCPNKGQEKRLPWAAWVAFVSTGGRENATVGLYIRRQHTLLVSVISSKLRLATFTATPSTDGRELLQHSHGKQESFRFR